LAALRGAGCSIPEVNRIDDVVACVTYSNACAVLLGLLVRRQHVLLPPAEEMSVVMWGDDRFRAFAHETHRSPGRSFLWHLLASSTLRTPADVPEDVRQWCSDKIPGNWIMNKCLGPVLRDYGERTASTKRCLFRSPSFTAVVGGCGNCRFFCTGPAFLLQQAHKLNELMLECRELGENRRDWSEKLCDLSWHDDGETKTPRHIQIEVREIKGTIEETERSLEPLILERTIKSWRKKCRILCWSIHIRPATTFSSSSQPRVTERFSCIH
jgi:hypothetical protein